MAAAITLDIVGKHSCDDGSCRYAVVVLQRPGKFGDTRRTTVSATDTEDDGVAVFLDFGPQLGIVGEHAGLFMD